MDFDKTNKWLTLIANFGVVAGLCLLVLELNQASKLAETEAYVSRTQAIGDHFTQLALSTDLAEILTRVRSHGLDSLTEAEQLRVFGWELARMYRVQGQYYQYQQGFLGRETIEKAMALGAVPSARLWRELGIVIDNDDFKAELEQMEAESAN